MQMREIGHCLICMLVAALCLLSMPGMAEESADPLTAQLYCAAGSFGPVTDGSKASAAVVDPAEFVDVARIEADCVVTSELGKMSEAPQTSGECGASLTWELEDDATLTIRGTGEMQDYTASDGAGPWGKDVRRVIIEEGVTTIGAYAFNDCRSLSEVSLPDSLTTIENFAFCTCVSLTAVELPGNLTTIGHTAFAACFNLEEINLPDSMTSIGEDAFASTAISSAVIPSGVKTLNYTFNDCENLNTVKLSEGVTTIGVQTFAECTGLTEISIPSTVTSIGANAFSNCSSLAEIVLPDGVFTISGNAMEGCPAVLYAYQNTTTSRALDAVGYEYIALADEGECGDNVTWTLDANGTLRIRGSGAMKDYSNDAPAPWGTEIKALEVGEGVTYIGKATFKNYEALKTVRLPSSLKFIAVEAFHKCNGLMAVYIPSLEDWLSIEFVDYNSNPLTYAGNLYVGGGLLTELVIPDGVERIGKYTFQGCSSIRSVVIPGSVKEMYHSAFFNNSALTDVYAPSLEAWMHISFETSYANPMLSAENLYLGGKLATDIVIPETYTEIPDYAFCYCDSLTSVILPPALIRIGQSAFAKCTGLTSIVLPPMVETIGGGAFSECTSLKNFQASENLKSIGSYAFSGCTPLKEIRFANNLEFVGERAFHGCYVVMLYADRNSRSAAAISAAEYQFVDPEYPELSLSARNNAEGKRVLTVFKCLTDVNTVKIPQGVIRILSGAFSSCSNLKSITIPDGVTSLDGSIFSGCTGLKDIYIPNSVTSIGSSLLSSSYGKCTVYCYEYSYAETWAAQKGYKVVLLDEQGLSAHLSVTLQETANVNLGDTLALSYGVFPDLPDAAMQWSSGNPSVVTVDAEGVIKTWQAGTAVITLRVGSASAACTVTVNAVVTSLVLPDEIYMVAKTSRQLPLTILPANAKNSLTYTTSDSVFASINNAGLVTAGAVGSATITVKDQIFGCTATTTIRICYPVTAVSFADMDATVVAGGQRQMTANVTMRGDTCVNRLVTFSSSDERVANIDQNGLLTGRAAGTAVITAMADSGASASVMVMVRAFHGTVLPASLVTVDEAALMGTAIERVLVPSGVRTIASRAFANCSGLTEIVIPASVTDIAADAFTGCSGLTIIAPQGSAAHAYAVRHDIAWRAQ